MTVNDDARQFNWMLDVFVKETSGVTDAVAVSCDGLLMAMSNTLEVAGAEQVAAIISGFVSQGMTRCFGFEELNQIVVAMQGGSLIVSSISRAGCLGVAATPGCDIGGVGYQTTLLVERAGQMLTPELVTVLKNLVLAR
jgi:predicted regulator of Ras-like GTPase activity (Roadblock/LC7/MglB family)